MTYVSGQEQQKMWVRELSNTIYFRLRKQYPEDHPLMLEFEQQAARCGIPLEQPGVRILRP